MALTGQISIAVISADSEVIASARRRLADSRFSVLSFPPGLNLHQWLRSAGARIALIDVRKPGPLILRILRGLSDSPDMAHVPLILLDPEGFFDFDPLPYGAIRNLEVTDLPATLEAAASAAATFEKAGARNPSDLRLSEAAQLRFREFIQRDTGIVLEKTGGTDVEEFLRKRMFARKINTGWEYLNFLQLKDMAADEFQRLIPSVTVGETSFFRTQSHFKALKRVIIPDLLSRKKKGRSRLRVWSAGCATGEEAYSIAITFHQEVADLDEWDFSVLGTDINGFAVQKAKEATYREKDLRRIPKPLKERYFANMGKEYFLDDRIRNLVQFRALNLNAWAASPGFEGVEPGMDLIFCENVIIYFTRPVIERVIRRFSNILNPGGYLFLGYSESLYKIDHPFENISFQDTYFYRKPFEEKEVAQALREKERKTRFFVPTPELPTFENVHSSAVPGGEAQPKLAEGRRNGSLAADPGKLPPGRGEENGSDAYAPEILNPELRRAFFHVRKGRFQEAMALLNAVLEGHPLDPDAHYLKGLAAEGGGDPDTAALEWRRALFLDPANVASHLRMGDHLARSGALAAALVHFRNALKYLEAGAMPAVMTLEGVLSGPKLLDLCNRTVRALEAEEVA